MWETQHNNMQTWIVSRFWLCGRPWRLKSQHQEDSYAFSKAKHFVPISWMCKKQTSVSHSFTEDEIISLDAGLSRAWSFGFSDWSISFTTRPNQQIQRSGVTGKPVAEHHTPQEKPNSNQARQSGSEWCWSRFVQRETLSIWCYVIRLWGQWSRD